MSVLSRASGALLLAMLVACDEPPAARPPAPTLLLAVDGLEWSVLLPLLAAGELPTFAGWIENGQAGLLESMRPTKSPVIWTTVATSKQPEDHGVLDFVKRAEDGSRSLYTSADRSTAALWNMATAHGRQTAVIGWWMTHPVEPIDGVMVAQTNTLPGEEGAAGALWKGAPKAAQPQQVYPPTHESYVNEVLLAADDGLEELVRKVFGDMEPPLPRPVARLLKASRWSLRADAVYLEIASHLLAGEGEPFDLAMLYLGGADVVAHRFWRYLEPERYEHVPSAAEVERFGPMVPDYYRYLDRTLGRLVADAGTDWNILVISDHGMVPHNQDASFDGTKDGQIISGSHFEAPPGVLIASGPDIRRVPLPGSLAELEREDLRVLGSVFDVTPTVLTLMGLPLASDFEGRSLDHLLAGAPQRLPSIASYDADYVNVVTAADDEGDDERMEQLRALGYIGD